LGSGESNGGWTQGFALVRQAYYHLSNSVASFCAGYFWDRVSLYAWVVMDCDSPICASSDSWEWQMCATIPGIDHDGGLVNFLLDWSWTMILPISTFQVARITGLSHCAHCENFWKIMHKIFLPKACENKWTYFFLYSQVLNRTEQFLWSFVNYNKCSIPQIQKKQYIQYIFIEPSFLSLPLTRSHGNTKFKIRSLFLEISNLMYKLNWTRTKRWIIKMK
jgi:hypothetical protein